MREQGAVSRAAGGASRWMGAVAGRLVRTRGLVAPALLGAFVAAAGVAGALGYVAGERGLADKVRTRIVEPALARAFPSKEDAVALDWRRIETNAHPIEAASVHIARPGEPLVFQLASVGDDLVIASRHGRLSVLDSQGRLERLGTDVPMRLEELGQTELSHDPIFDYMDVRTVDLLSVETGPGAFDLYASFYRYVDNCFELAVARTPLAATDDGLKAATGEWEDVYAARPCIPVKYTGMRFAGHEGGGRLALLNDDTLLLSVGVFQYDNVAAGQRAGQDPTTDLGKIIAISLPTKQGRIYAQGFRNPQGLTIARDGRVWETEHGPQGGDEVNLIVEGQNYGWPYVTYGMDYGSPLHDWPYTETPGRHDGFSPPAFAFTPSIGISNIIEPDPREFPRWDRELVAASLSAGSLFVLRVQGDHIVAAEPIPFGTRLRDLVSLSDGRIALATDDGALILVRNADGRRGGPDRIVGAAALAAATPEIPYADQGPHMAGAQNFFYYCGSCHSVTGEAGVGPPLDGLMGRRVGSSPGYSYSPALSGHGGAWTPKLLRSFLLEPQSGFAGTRMPPSDIESYEIPPLVEYLESTKAAERRRP